MSLKPRSLLLIVSLAQPHSNYQQARSDTGSSSWDEKGGLIFNQAIYLQYTVQSQRVSQSKKE